MRWFGLILAVVLASSTAADAQVFKPKSKGAAKAAPKSDSSEKKATPAKKSARTSPGKKRVTTKSKKSSKHSDDQASESTPKESDKDFVQITDDDDIE